MTFSKIFLNDSDIRIVKYQISREVIRFLGVARRCGYSNPVAIAQDPFSTRDILFPTIYHLSCPRLVKLISRLEAGPFFKLFKKSVMPAGAFHEQYRELMSVYKSDIEKHVKKLYKFSNDANLIKNYRLIIIQSSDPKNFSDNYSEEVPEAILPGNLFNSLIEKGLAGSREIYAVKCLHALYAYLIGREGRSEYAAFFKSMIEDEITSHYPEEFCNIFKH